MRLALFVTAVYLFASAIATAAPSKDPCEDLPSVQRSVGASGSFEFKYRFLKGQPGEPIVIYLPGGPGQGSISGGDPRVNSNYGFIQTDPRGAGCNQSFWSLKNGDITTELMADDVIAMITQEKLDNFILFGTSFGTALATVITHRLTKAGLPAPRSLVLQGVVGRAFSDEENDAGYVREWALQEKQLDPTLLAPFQKDIPPLEFTERQWGQFINQLLTIGTHPAYPSMSMIEVYLGMLRQPGQLQDLKASVRDANTKHPTEMESIYKKVGCREFTEGWKTDTRLVRGKLVSQTSEEDVCGGIPLERPFDAKNYPIETTIYYFNGINDPSTPIYQARHHAIAQPRSERIVIDVHGGGHNALKINLMDCAPAIWQDILTGVKNLRTSLASCALKTDFSIQK